MTNYLVVNDGTDYGTLTGRLASVVQGEVGKVLIIDIQDQAGNDYPITGATGISASMTTPAGVTTAVTGTITVANGGLSWPLSSGDVGTDGEFSVIVQFTKDGAIVKTHPVRWIVIEDPEATAVQNQAVVGVSSRLEWTVHIPGSLSANVNARWEVPSGCKVSHISAVTSNNSDATMTFGIGSDTDSILASTAIGDSNTPTAFTSADWAITNPTGELVTGDIAVLTVDYDGASGTAAADLTVIITTTSQVISVAGAVEDISDLTAVGYAADDFIQWNGSVFVNVTPATVLSEIAAQASSVKLTAIAALTWAANSIILLTGTATAAVQALAAHVVTFLQSASAADARAAIGALPTAADIVAVASSRDIATSDGGKLLTVTATAALNCPNGLGTGLQCAIASHGGTTTITAATTLQYLDGGLQTAASGVTVNTQCTLVHMGSNVWTVYGDVTPI